MIRPLLVTLLLLVGPPALADTLTPLGRGWSRYVNERFGTSLEVPDLFAAEEPPPENGDGRAFRAEDGARLWVYGTYAPYAVMSNFEAYKDNLLETAQADGLSVTYKRDGKGWLVFSGVKDADIVYAKAIESCEAAHEFRIVYPAAKKRFYDPIVTRLSRSLRCRPSR